MTRLSLSAADRAAVQRAVQKSSERHHLPAQTRAATKRERQAVRDALATIVGSPEAERLVELGRNLPPEEPLPPRPDNAWTRAREMLDTRAGRERLRTLRWEQV